MKYQVKEIKHTVLILDDADNNEDNYLMKNDDDTRVVVAYELPEIGGYSLEKKGDNYYSFGCGEGKFTYQQLLKQIKAAETEFGETEQLPALIGSNGHITTLPVVEESASYFIVEGGHAYSKAIYHLGTKSSSETSFGNFIYNKDDEQYEWNENYAGETREEILEAMLQAKEIIEFLEEKGDYAKKAAEEVVESAS